ncbi:hypothetical protein LJ656_24925 [Paraburkholderia sp. MMS20-SJTR3]|uniref:Uncharacterized protein n=1 Tax=Paraburkholderia sejongensis TaxID=2886946 RepID=A0ABS8K1M4_9BURK|nr:hypothetical protein [Paraburkholderia sp. MMS20-SJTR3]MCC8395833.1 hypothetical protein [Paraburkholderia sp. MMS20-SJTR3]
MRLLALLQRRRGGILRERGVELREQIIFDALSELLDFRVVGAGEIAALANSRFQRGEFAIGVVVKARIGESGARTRFLPAEPFGKRGVAQQK